MLKLINEEVSSLEYCDRLKNMCIPLNKWSFKFKDIIFLIDNLVYKENTSMNINKSIFVHYTTSSSWKNFNSRESLCNIEEYNQLVNLYLELAGVKQVIKDYILISSFSFLKKLPSSYSDIKKNTEDSFFFDFKFELLFNDHNLSFKVNEQQDKTYFNKFLFKEGAVTDEKEVYFINKFTEFTSCFFFLFFYKFEKDISLKFQDCLNINYIKKLEEETLAYLNEFYGKKKIKLFSGYYNTENSCIGKNFLTNSSFIAGEWEKFTLGYRLKNINNFSLWFSFALNWQHWLFNAEAIINSEVKVEYVGNCNYILKSLE